MLAYEVAALADACMRAATVTGDNSWLAGVKVGVSWFLGDNDTRVPLLDERTGGAATASAATVAVATREPSRRWR